VASRRHCRVLQHGSQVCFEDLGSRNPALVNGVPVTRELLRPGDEIAIGRELFLVTGVAEDTRRTAVEAAALETGSLAQAEPVLMALDERQGYGEARPRTVHDLAQLFDVAREFSSTTTIQELVAKTAQALQDRFDPRALWIARVLGQDDLSFYDTEQFCVDAGPTVPVEAIRQALHERRATLVQNTIRRGGGRSRTFTMAAPVMLVGQCVAVLTVETVSPRGSYMAIPSTLRWTSTPIPAHRITGTTSATTMDTKMAVEEEAAGARPDSGWSISR